jgi:hypothetical protein
MTTAETVHIDGEVWTRDEAEKHLGFLVRQMDNLGQAGAHQGMTHGRHEERFDELKREAIKIEVALGLK